MLSKFLPQSTSEGGKKGKNQHRNILVLCINTLYNNKIDCLIANQQFVCVACNKNFISEKNMNTHMGKFHAKKEFPCEKCKYIAKDEKQLKEHIRNHTSGESNCSISQNKFKDEKKMTSDGKKSYWPPQQMMYANWKFTGLCSSRQDQPTRCQSWSFLSL